MIILEGLAGDLAMAESDKSKPDNAIPLDSEGKPLRRAGVTNFFAALKHIGTASDAAGVKQRLSDYITIALVFVCILSLFGAVLLPVSQHMKLVPLVLTVLAVIAYIINRLGIIIGLSSRQALIVWQILIASFWLGASSAMLVSMACYFYFLGGSPHSRQILILLAISFGRIASARRVHGKSG